MALTLVSTAFGQNEAIPEIYTADGKNLSPPLSWSGAPSGTLSYALVMQDPDAPSGLFGHWGIYNLRETSLDEGLGLGDTPFQARNGFGDLNYDGPAPPRQHGVHHYHFRLAALSIERLDIEIIDVAELWNAIQPYLLEETALIGTYERAS